MAQETIDTMPAHNKQKVQLANERKAKLWKIIFLLAVGWWLHGLVNGEYDGAGDNPPWQCGSLCD